MRILVLSNPQARSAAHQAIDAAPYGYVMRLQENTRNLEQNARLWACLSDIADQVDWYGKKLSPSDWKHVFSSSLKRLEVVPNLEGTGFVSLGQSTSAMTKAEFSELLELINAFAAERGVTWTWNEPSSTPA